MRQAGHGVRPGHFAGPGHGHRIEAVAGRSKSGREALAVNHDLTMGSFWRLSGGHTAYWDRA